MDPMEAIRVTFFQECEELLAQLEEGLLAMEQGEHDAETINSVFRAVHSIKGGGGAFGLDPLVRFAHVFENLLDQIRGGVTEAGHEVIAALLRASDMLADHVSAARDGGTADEARSDAIAAALVALTEGEAHGGDEAAPAEFEGLSFTPMTVALDEEPAGAAQAAWIIRFKPHASLYNKANDAVLVLRELGSLGRIEVEVDAEAVPLLDAMDPEGAYLDWTVRLTGETDEAAVREVFSFVDEDCDLDIAAADAAPDAAIDLLSSLLAIGTAGAEAPPLRAPAIEDIIAAAPAGAPGKAETAPAKAAESAALPAPQTIRVDLERVDRMINLVGELVINQAMLAQRVMESSGAGQASDVNLALADLEHLTRGIQDSVMAIRAQPVKSVFQRMPRLVREVGEAVGKRVRLVTEGENTEVDKTVVERLSEPITHMIRNAIDHGLESPADREAAGKPAEGSVRLTAGHRSGRIVIEVSDDGKGVDRARVKAKAIEKGLIAADAVLTDEEIDNLIFLPGFSTAAAISDISGRGVGMDVVKKSVQALGGRISISSQPGQGSRFTMSLPLTLAVLDGMVVSVGDQTLVAPLTAIVESLKPRPEEVRPLGPDNFVLQIRDVYVPLIDIGQAMGFSRTRVDPTEGVALLVESEGAGRVALMVDNIQGQRQVVIKSLEANYRPTEGVAAATILGDGRVALILDIDGVVTANRRVANRRDPPAREPLARTGT